MNVVAGAAAVVGILATAVAAIWGSMDSAETVGFISMFVVFMLATND